MFWCLDCLCNRPDDLSLKLDNLSKSLDSLGFLVCLCGYRLSVILSVFTILELYLPGFKCPFRILIVCVDVRTVHLCGHCGQSSIFSKLSYSLKSYFLSKWEKCDLYHSSSKELICYNVCDNIMLWLYRNWGE